MYPDVDRVIVKFMFFRIAKHESEPISLTSLVATDPPDPPDQLRPSWPASTIVTSLDPPDQPDQPRPAASPTPRSLTLGVRMLLRWWGEMEPISSPHLRQQENLHPTELVTHFCYFFTPCLAFTSNILVKRPSSQVFFSIQGLINCLIVVRI